jgi:hypothetical protein
MNQNGDEAAVTSVALSLRMALEREREWEPKG